MERLAGAKGASRIVWGDSAMTIGTIGSCDAPQGYCIVRVAGSRHEIFVDRPAIERSGPACLSAGQEVEFDVICNTSGNLIARNLRTPAVHS
jgi:cold shock CspA family protein